MTTHGATRERVIRTPPFGSPHVFVFAVVDGDDPHAIYRIQQSTSILGRAANADLQVDNPEVSKRHLEVVADGPMCGVRDLDSRNGTLINGRELRPGVLHRLRHLDEIEVGSTRLLFIAARRSSRP